MASSINWKLLLFIYLFNSKHPSIIDINDKLLINNK